MRIFVPMTAVLGMVRVETLIILIPVMMVSIVTGLIPAVVVTVSIREIPVTRPRHAMKIQTSAQAPMLPYPS